MPTFEVIAFDADDTLWHNEHYYHHAQDEFKRLMQPYAAPQVVAECLYTIEVSNLAALGYGIKPFILSMIETAVYIPNVLTWAHETAGSTPVANPNFYEIEHIGLFPNLLAKLESEI